MRNIMFSWIALCGLFLFTSAHAQPIEEGKNYISLRSPVATQEPDKIEVVALFWYGCPHCYQLEPTLDAWQKKLPEDVNFIRVPAMFGGIWNLHGQLYYSLEAIGATEQLHAVIFDVIQNNKQRLATAAEITDFVVKQGIDKDSFEKAWNSFAVKSQLQKAKRLAIAYQISGVPALVVNGKYTFDIASAGGLKETTEVADYLITHERNN